MAYYTYENDRVQVLYLRPSEAGHESVVGLYTDDEAGTKLMRRVARSLGIKFPEGIVRDATFQLNIPTA